MIYIYVKKIWTQNPISNRPETTNLKSTRWPGWTSIDLTVGDENGTPITRVVGDENGTPITMLEKKTSTIRRTHDFEYETCILKHLKVMHLA